MTGLEPGVMVRDDIWMTECFEETDLRNDEQDVENKYDLVSGEVGRKTRAKQRNEPLGEFGEDMNEIDQLRFS